MRVEDPQRVEKRCKPRLSEPETKHELSRTQLV
jgi:hypothetical protein